MINLKNSKKGRSLQVKVILLIVIMSISFFGCKSKKEQGYNSSENKSKSEESSYTNNTESKSWDKYDTKFNSGMYKVGSDIPEGEYIVFAEEEDEDGYFAILSSSEGQFSNIIANDNFSYNSIINIKPGTYLELVDAVAVPISEVTDLDTSGEGMFKVGLHIQPGEYKLIAETEESGYYEVTSNSSHKFNSIVSNANFKNSAYVTVRDGQYLTLVDCKIDKK